MPAHGQRIGQLSLAQTKKGGGSGSAGAPAVPTLTAPSTGANVYNGFGVTLSATSTDGDLTRIDWVLDPGGSEVIVATDSVAPYSQTWTPTGIAQGTHTLVARAVRGAFSTNSASITITHKGSYLSDAAVTHVWIGEALWTGGGGTLTTWTAAKGGVDFAATASPVLQNTLGSGSLRNILFNGSTQFCTADALAAVVTGNDIPWSMTVSARFVAVAAPKGIVCFAGTSDSQNFHNFQTVSSSGNKWESVRVAASGPAAIVTTAVPDTSWHVVTMVFTGTAITFWVDGVLTNISATAHDANAVTLSKCTLAAFRGATTASFCNIEIRAVAMGLNQVWTNTQRVPIETEWIAEAA